jgi:glycosyltransferase involved in cell wall biosynthesis
LVIVVQANGYLLNYFLLPLTWLRLKRVAFWGHAFNHQGNSGSINERFKRLLATKVHWWFTYTKETARYLVELGFPAARITVIENAVDTSAFALEVSSVDSEVIAEVRRRLNFPVDACVAVFCGSLYADKQLDFLVRVGEELHQRHASFRMIVIGDGAERDWMRTAAESRSWLQYCGAQFGLEKAKLFAASDFFLNPGWVGLAILDSFAAGLPFITSNCEGHGPEVAYLVHEGNGLMLPFKFDAFVDGVSRAIEDRDLLASLQEGARVSGKRYSVENMVSNVASGIVAGISHS